MTLQYSLPGSVLKTELLSHLTKASSFSRIRRFFDLLVSGQKLIEQTENTVPEDSDLMSKLLQKFDAISEKIKDALAKVSAEVFIQTLSGGLHTEIKAEDKTNLESFLLKIKNQESNIASLEYLESLINYFDHLVKIYFNSELYGKHFGTFKHPVKDFTELNQLFYQATRMSAMNILMIILQITIDDVEVTPEEKNQWQFLLLEAADVIKQYVERDVGSHLSLEYSLHIRSCVQAVLDFLADSPAEYGILLKKLDKIEACKEICNNLIQQDSGWPLTDDSDFEDDVETMVGEPAWVKRGDDGVFYIETITESKVDFISKMPPSHTWWQKLKRDTA